MASIINATTTAGVSVQGDNSGSLQLATNNGTTAVTIDTSQNVGIGTASPAQKLDVSGSARLTFAGGSNYIEFQSASNYVGRNGSTADIWLNAINGQKTILGVNSVAVAQCSITDFQFNSGYGSVATAYGCRAWVNFNGQGTPAIRASGNVNSITDLGGGFYNINFSTAMPDANYAATCLCTDDSTANRGINIPGTNTNMTTTGFQVNVFPNQDPSAFLAIVVR